MKSLWIESAAVAALQAFGLLAGGMLGGWSPESLAMGAIIAAGVACVAFLILLSTTGAFAAAAGICAAAPFALSRLDAPTITAVTVCALLFGLGSTMLAALAARHEGSKSDPIELFFVALPFGIGLACGAVFLLRRKRIRA